MVNLKLTPINTLRKSIKTKNKPKEIQGLLELANASSFFIKNIKNWGKMEKMAQKSTIFTTFAP